MRPEFEEIVKGWSPSNLEDLCDRVERVNKWINTGMTLNKKELLVFQLLIKSIRVHELLEEMHG